MTAHGKPVADPTNTKKKVLTLDFKHQHALLVFKPSEGFLRYVSPDGGFEYRDEARELLGSQASEDKQCQSMSHGRRFIPCHYTDFTFCRFFYPLG